MLDRTADPAAAAISLQAGDLHDAFARTRHAICREQTRYYLAGVYIHPSPDGKVLNFVATDGHRLAHVRVPISPGAQFAPVLVKADFVSAALKLLGRKSQQLLSATLRISPRSVSLVNWQGERIETAPVECTYLDYRRAVPIQPPTRAVVARTDFVAALEPLVGFLKMTKQRAVKLAIADDALTVSVKVQASYPYEVAATAQTIVKLAQSAEEPYETGFNVEYLLGALKTFSDHSRRAPAVFSVCSHECGSPHVLLCDSHETFVLMPMRV